MSVRIGGMIVLASFLLATPVTAGEGASLKEIRAFLFYEDSGRLSDNVLGRQPEFAGWNTIIGAGDAEGPANDLLVVAVLSSDDETYDQGKLDIWVTNEAGKTIARRSFNSALIAANGETSMPLWLNDVGCAGLLVFHARYNGAEQRA